MDKSNCWCFHVWSNSVHNPYKFFFNILDNLWNILHTDISNDIPFLVMFLWPYNGRETQRDNQPLSWSSKIIFWLWRYYFHLVQTKKFQRDVQGDVLLTMPNLLLFPNIVIPTIFHVRICELHQVCTFPPIMSSNWINHDE